MGDVNGDTKRDLILRLRADILSVPHGRPSPPDDPSPPKRPRGPTTTTTPSDPGGDGRTHRGGTLDAHFTPRPGATAVVETPAGRALADLADAVDPVTVCSLFAEAGLESLLGGFEIQMGLAAALVPRLVSLQRARVATLQSWVVATAGGGTEWLGFGRIVELLGWAPDDVQSVDEKLVRCLTQALLRRWHPEWQIGDWYRQMTHMWHWPRCLTAMRRAVILVGLLRRSKADLDHLVCKLATMYNL